MPDNLVKTPDDERDWKRARQLASKSGHDKNWKYVVSIFENIKKSRGSGTEKKAFFDEEDENNVTYFKSRHRC